MNQISVTRGREALEKMEDGMQKARVELRRVDERLVRFARDQPLVATFSALAVGFLLGRLLARR
jgi:ElaB/YqjD/DUF883 family membrane-anchored ribosome-binding protein